MTGSSNGGDLVVLVPATLTSSLYASVLLSSPSETRYEPLCRSATVRVTNAALPCAPLAVTATLPMCVYICFVFNYSLHKSRFDRY